MLMTWIEMLVLVVAGGGAALWALPQPQAVRIRSAGRLIPGRHAGPLECFGGRSYSPVGGCSFSVRI